jgi:hypothetical protein
MHLGGAEALWLATNTETTNKGAVTLNVTVLHVIEQTTALSNELHEATSGVVITFVHLQVLGEMRDTVRQNRDLNFGRAGVLVVMLVVLNDLLLLSHGINLPYESGVPLQVTVRATHMISVADRI